MQNRRFIYYILIAGIAFIFRTLPPMEILDDAYITFRMAANLANGNGFVYNVGERVLSSTTPAYVLLLSVLARITTDIPSAAVLLNALLGSTVAVSLFLGVRKWCRDNDDVAFIAAMLYAVSPSSVIYSIAGMETSMFEAAIVVSCVLFIFQRDLLVAVMAGLLPLIRPEGIAVSTVLGVGLIFTKRRRVFLYGAVALVPLLLWALWSVCYFGDLIPHSVREKQHFFDGSQYAVGVTGFLRQWLYHFYSLFLANPISAANMRNTKFATILVGLLPFGIGYLYSLYQAFRYWPRMIPFAVVSLVIACAYIVGQAGLPFPWYFVPTGGLFLAVSFCGMWHLLVDCMTGVGASEHVGRSLSGFACLFLGLFLCCFHVVERYRFHPSFGPVALDEHVLPWREQVYAEAGRWMNSRISQYEDMVLCSEVGAIGYFCESRVWDQHLTTPPWIQQSGRDLVELYRPRFISFMGLYPPSPEFQKQQKVVRVGDDLLYKKVYCVNGKEDMDTPGRYNVLVYERSE